MITINKKVTVLPEAGYGDRFVGRTGIVKMKFAGQVGVLFDGYKNPDNRYGLFWFWEEQLAVVDDTEVFVSDMIRNVVFSGPKTIIIWKDGSKTIVSCGDEDQYDRYAGFCAAFTKKIFGSTSKIKKILEKYAKEDNNAKN